MYIYTTPTITMEIGGVDFEDVEVFRVALKRGNKQFLKELYNGDSGVITESNLIVVTLTQEETAEMGKGDLELQIRMKFKNDSVLATNKVSIKLEDVIDKVII